MTMQIDLSPTAQAALKKIGSTVADIRPDLNGDISDKAVIEACLFIVRLWLTEDVPMGDIVAHSFTVAMYPEMLS